MPFLQIRAHVMHFFHKLVKLRHSAMKCTPDAINYRNVSSLIFYFSRHVVAPAAPFLHFKFASFGRFNCIFVGIAAEDCAVAKMVYDLYKKTEQDQQHSCWFVVVPKVSDFMFISGTN